MSILFHVFFLSNREHFTNIIIQCACFQQEKKKMLQRLARTSYYKTKNKMLQFLNAVSKDPYAIRAQTFPVCRHFSTSNKNVHFDEKYSE